MERYLILALTLFALTHIDTLVVLTAFCLDADYGFPEVAVGHLLGFLIGLVGAVIAALLAAEFLRDWTFLLGIAPLSLGVWGLLRRHPDEVVEPELVPGLLGRVGVVTTAGIGLSGENMAVFIPFFVDLSSVELGVVLTAYVVGAGVVLGLAVVVAKGTSVFGHIPQWVHRLLVPIVLVIVGLYVIASGLIIT